MRAVLLHPPLCDPSSPPLGLAYLSAVLAQEDVEHEVLDLNLDFLDFLDGLVPSLPGEARQASAVAHTRRACATAARVWPEVHLEPWRLELPLADGNLAVMADIAQDHNGPFAAWLRDMDPLAAALARGPAWIGLSVSFMGQLAPALAIAAHIKQRSQATVILGGSLFKEFERWITPETPIWNVAHGVVVGPGEDVLRNLEQSSDGVWRPHGINDLPGGGWIASSSGLFDPPRPCFDHFPLDRYRAAGRVLPYRVFARCSWGKCTFCADSKYAAHTPAAGGEAEAVAEELTALARSHGAKGFYFLDAELPEKFMLDLARHMMRLGPDLRWGANARFARDLEYQARADLLFAGGCRFLRFGLESASPRVLTAMRKGISTELAARVLQAVHGAGMATHVYFMRGFPGETDGEWDATVRFLLDNARHIDMFNVSVFQLYPGSPLALRLGPQDSSGASPARWIYADQKLGMPTLDTRKLEEDFFTRKNFTRCHPTPADTILLADTESIRFENATDDTGHQCPGDEEMAP